jgi:hypothetical protein
MCGTIRTAPPIRQQKYAQSCGNVARIAAETAQLRAAAFAKDAISCRDFVTKSAASAVASVGVMQVVLPLFQRQRCGQDRQTTNARSSA